jgi:signal transduction histidine kinase
LTSGLLVAAVALFSGVLLWSERRALLEDQSRRLTEAAGGLADVCRAAVVGQQDLVLTNYLRRLGAMPEVLEASCLDDGGRVLGHTDLGRVQTVETGFKLPPDLTEKPTFSQAGDRLEARSLISVGARARGLARVTYDSRRLRERLEATLADARRRLLRVSLLVILVGFAGAFLATWAALASLGGLVSGVRAIAGGRLDRRITETGATEIALLSREFNAMAGRLAELDRMKSDFVNSVTHDLKSPLTAIKAALEVVQSGKARPEEVAADFLMIRENADRLMNLITSILEVAKIESGLVLDRRPVRLEDVAERVVRSFRPLAEPKGVKIDVLVKKDLPPVSADESKLERLLANLVGNAVKFTAQGRVTVDLDAEGGVQVVRVADTGPGIPPEAADKLFSKFYRVRRPGEKIEGTGLGLSIAKGIAEAHGGTLSVESTVGKGTVFSLRLPTAQEPAHPSTGSGGAERFEHDLKT